MDESQASRAGKFQDAARELGRDQDEGRWEERLPGVAKHKPEKPE